MVGFSVSYKFISSFNVWSRGTVKCFKVPPLRKHKRCRPYAEKKMSNQKDYTTTFFQTIKVFIIILGLLGPIWAINKYWTQKQTQWKDTHAKLIDIKANERTRDKKEEHFLKLTYEYQVDNQAYQSYKEEILNDETEIEKRTEEIKKENGEQLIFYNVETPGQSTFNINETSADINLIYVLAPCLLLIAGAAYWLFKVRYEHYYKT
jgi:predicted  nucleic acid-binding Zn-ribbon protein